MVGRLQLWAATVGTAALGALAWSVTAGSTAASASARLRSGTVHAQLASHVTSGANALSSGLTLQNSGSGAGVMAAIVGLLAVFSLTFLVVTFIRRRVTAA